MTEELTIKEVSKKNEGINSLEKFMLDELPMALEGLEHVHTPGLYGRKWSADAGTLWVTRQHKVEHQFVILRGAVIVWVNGEEVLYEVGYNGITKPGTRRILYVLEDVVWMTFHPNPDNLNEDDFVELVTEEHNNELFSEDDEKQLLELRSHIEKKYLTSKNVQL